MTETADPATSSSGQAPLVVGSEPISASTTLPSEPASTSSDDAPAVVAVVVATDPGDYFEETLRSLQDQDYGNLSVLVVDAASQDPVAPRVAEILPDAFVHRMSGKPTFTTAANQAMTLVQGASFLMICEDDVALANNATSLMIEELYRSNAGIVTPKIVDWDDPRRLRQIGMGSDRFAVSVDMVDRSEFDQEQYDSSRDVFVAPSGVQLIRADLFDALGGFDPAMAALNADVDLSWRAHALGARVVAAPNARVRHKEVEALKPIEDQRRELARNRLRTVLVTSSTASLFTVVPVALLLLVLEAVYSVLAGRRSQAASALSAITWNASRLGEIRTRRKQLAEDRTASDGDVRAMQFSGSARLNQFFRGQFGSGQDRFVGLFGSLRSSLQGDAAQSTRVAALVLAIVGVVLFFGSRHLISRGIVAVGQIPDIPGAGALLGEWWGGWRSAGLGSPGNPTSAFLVLALARIVFFWGGGLLELALILGPIIGGVIAMWRLVRPLGSPQASAVAAATYGFNPLVVSMVSAGRWDALVLWGCAPVILGSVLRLQGLAPFGRTGGDPGPGVVRRPVPVRLLRLGLAVAAATTFVPGAPLMAIWMLAMVALASVVVTKPVGLIRLALGVPVVVFVPFVMHLPFGYDVIRNGSWAWFVGPRSPESVFDSLADLIRFAPGSLDPSFLTLGILAAAGVSLVIARGRRFDVAASGWVVAVGSFLLAWSVRRDWLPFELPDTETLLVPAAAGLSLAVGASLRSTELDLRTHAFGWRHMVVAAGAFGLVLTLVGGLSNSLDGRWGLPSQGYGQFADLIAEDDEAAGRTLWLAAPEVAPFDTVTSPGGVSYAVTIGGRPDVLDRWSPGVAQLDAEIGAQLDLAVGGETVALGRLLAAYGINRVVLMPQLAPVPYDGPTISPATGDVSMLDILSRQLDLQNQPGTPTLSVFDNRASVGPAVSAEGLALLPSDPESRLGFDLSNSTLSGFTPDGSGRWTRPAQTEPSTDAPSTVIAVPGRDWTVARGDAEVAETVAGMLEVSPAADEQGVISVAHNTPLVRWLALVMQFALIGAAVAVARDETVIE